MSKSFSHFLPLPVLAVLAAAPLAAQAPLTVTGEPQSVYQERVSFGDLDLRTGMAQHALRQRVRQAATRVCILAEGAFHNDPSLNAGLSCDAQTYEDARPQISAAIASAKAGRQIALAFVVTAPRAR